jgi:ribosomal-protein-alanine N-acetyltransferase
MISFDLGRSSRPPVLEAGAIRLAVADLADYPAWLELRRRSRAHLTRWEPDWQERDETLDAFRLRLRSYDRQHRARSGLSLVARLIDGGALIGGVTLSDIRFHSLQSATIGYWIGEPHLRQGYGIAMVDAVVRHAFGEIRLNRVEAACQPGNLASRALLAKAGFHEEGLARDYLYINGAWRDHLLFARTARDHFAPTLRRVAAIRNA